MGILSLQMDYDSFEEQWFHLTLFSSSFHRGFVGTISTPKVDICFFLL